MLFLDILKLYSGWFTFEPLPSTFFLLSKLCSWSSFPKAFHKAKGHPIFLKILGLFSVDLRYLNLSMLNIFPRLCCLSRTVASFRFRKQFIRHGDFICSAFIFHFNCPSLPRKQINSQLNLSLLAAVSSLWSLPCLSFSLHFLFTLSCSFFL